MFSLAGESVSRSCTKKKARVGAIFFCPPPTTEVLAAFFPGQSQILCPSFPHVKHVPVLSKHFLACLLQHFPHVGRHPDSPYRGSCPLSQNCILDCPCLVDCKECFLSLLRSMTFLGCPPQLQ